MLKIVAVIPARLASTRFPRKVLFPFSGVPMLEHVRRRALLVPEFSDVYVATCDQEVAEFVTGNGGKVIMTSDDHANGTSRVAEAIAGLDCTHVVLPQGDEPLLLPRHVEQVIAAIRANPHGDAWNATAPINEPDELDRHSFVKCAVTPAGRWIHAFRRSPSVAAFADQQSYIRKVLGLIAYRRDYLLELAASPAGAIEKLESIEQLRVLEGGGTMISVPVLESLPSVNEPHEADLVVDYIENDEEQRALLARILA